MGVVVVDKVVEEVNKKLCNRYLGNAQIGAALISMGLP